MKKLDKIEFPKIIVYNRKRHVSEMAIIETIDGMVYYTIKDQQHRPITKLEMVDYIKQGITVIKMVYK